MAAFALAELLGIALTGFASGMSSSSIAQNSDRKVPAPVQPANLSCVRFVWAMECVRVRFGKKSRHPGVPALQGADEGGGADRPCPKRSGTDRV